MTFYPLGIQVPGGGGSGDSFFEENGDGHIEVKEAYKDSRLIWPPSADPAENGSDAVINAGDGAAGVATDEPGSDGGNFEAAAGAGGDGIDDGAGGAGGELQFESAGGGNAPGAGTGGVAGVVSFTAVNGGTSVAGTGGPGGDVSFTHGAGGVGGGGNGADGNFLFTNLPATDPNIAGSLYSMNAAGVAAELAAGSRYVLISNGP